MIPGISPTLTIPFGIVKIVIPTIAIIRF
jgi:hypothetical protein